VRAHLRHPTLSEIREAVEEGARDRELEHRVPEELEALVVGQATVLVGEGAVRERALQQLGDQLRVPERRAQRGVVGQRTGRPQRTWRRSARAPYWPHSPHARCGRCWAPHAGFAQVTRVGATAFQADRRCRVLLRDIFRFGTATVLSYLLESDGRP